MSAHHFTNVQPKRILVITLRYLGDTLLVTPLISSLKQAYPQAKIDVLLPKGNVGMLEGNPDIERLIPMTDKADKVGFIRLLYRLWHQYDLAISTQAGDRPVLCAVLAGKFRIGFVTDNTSRFSWKYLFLNQSVKTNNHPSHAVLENLRCCSALGIKPCYRLTPPYADAQSVSELSANQKYVVMHIVPQWRYKQWHDQGWIAVAEFFGQRGYAVVLTGSAQPAEQQALARIQSKLSFMAVNLSGQLSLGQLARLIAKAELFIGPDTGITHLAAATGAPTFALFGPTDPQKWAPWPINHQAAAVPFLAKGSQKNGNVHLIQGSMPQSCVPCQLEGCDRHQQSFSACLDGLSAQEVIFSIQSFLDEI